MAVGSALGLVLRPNPIHGALFLVVNLGCVAVLYLMLGAEFLAFAQVIVYAGAIMVLFVFAIMVLIPGKEETGRTRARPAAAGGAAGGACCSSWRHRAWPAADAPAGRRRDPGRGRGDRPAALHRLPVPVRADLGPAAGRDGRGAAAAPGETAGNASDGPRRLSYLVRCRRCSPVHDRRGGRARPPQPAGDLHVDRADAERGEPGLRGLRAAARQRPTGRSSSSSSWRWRRPRSRSGWRSSWPSSGSASGCRSTT